MKLLALCFTIFCCLLSAAPAKASQECETAVAEARYEQYFDTVMTDTTASYKAIENDQIAVLESYESALLKSGKWSEDEKIKLFTSIALAPEFTKPEQAKKAELADMTANLEKAFTSVKSNPKDVCVASDAALEAFSRIYALNQLQWNYMKSRLQEAAAVLQVSLPANKGQ
ncbi:MAG: hypothetical protein ACREO1_02450 [Arenimonas sp.]